MESYLISSHFDLITPDGYIESIEKIDGNTIDASILIKDISDAFIGFRCNEKNLIFNIKSTLAQIGLDAKELGFDINKKKKTLTCHIQFLAHSNIAKDFLKLLSTDMYVGKVFAQEESRKVRDPEYLIRMFGRCDRFSRPLLSFGSKKREDLILDKKKGYTIALLPLKTGVVEYDKEITSFLPALSKILKHKKFPTRDLLKIYQTFDEQCKKIVKSNEILLVKSEPLYIRTAFAKVKEEYLPKGFHHTSACILEPNTFESGDVYEFYGCSDEEIKAVPLEFYTLEPHREFVFFEDRDQLQIYLDDPKMLFKAFDTGPMPQEYLSSVYVVKGTQLESLEAKDWIKRDPKKNDFPGLEQPKRQFLLVENYIKEQPSYPFLKAIEDGLITSQGVLLTRHFPSPLMKKMLLSDNVQRTLKAIYFKYPSRSMDDFFSHEDRAFLLDLAKFAIPVFWVDQTSKKILQYVVKPHKDSGMFVPLNLTENFRKATFFGVYGSNLIEGHFDIELEKLLLGIKELKEKVDHPLLCSNTSLALVTGGGPGAMNVGNKVAKKLDILSCANIVDFRVKDAPVNEQLINPYIDAKMTYRLDRLVERQAEFHLDFPIILMGGIGSDFEYSLEEVKRKTGAALANPILLFGPKEYWKEKVTSRFQINLKTKTIKGSEWISNCFYCIQTASQGLQIYKDFFENKLKIGKNGPVYEDGFCSDY
ncbi:MAG: hypothetical protein K1060chlam5_00065 [Candidatus Anoxychlamydiales bacterium]|nr:hypothetical protein [Candidatus Anoxychlamydiales bacterium]